ALVTSAKQYIAKRDYRASVIQLKNALQQQPDNREARYLLGLSALESGDLVTAEIELKKAADLGLESDDLQVAMARTLYVTGDAQGVVNQFGGKTLAQPKAQAELRALVGNAELRRGRLPEAKAAFEQAISLDAENVTANVGLARLTAADRDINGALARADKALTISPSSYEALALKADLLAAQGQGDEATKTYRRAVEAAPNAIEPRLSLISHLIRQHSLDEAAKEVEALRKVAGRDIRVYYADATVLVEQRKFAEAKEAILQVLKVAPEHVPSLTLAGMAAFQTGAYAEA